jgi:YidC/Oxa1 family membrane protein insertase
LNIYILIKNNTFAPPARKKEMDRNTITGLLLMFLLVLGYNWYTAEEPQPEQTSSATIQTDSVAQKEGTTQAEIVQATEEPDEQMLARQNAERSSRYGVFAGAVGANEELYTLENTRVKVEISSKGGLFNSATLVDGFKAYWDSTDVKLWDPAKTEFILWAEYPGKGKMNLSELSFKKIAEQRTSNGQQLTMRLETNDPKKYIEYVYSLPDDSYLVEVNLNIVGLDQTVDISTARLDWNAASHHIEKGIQWERQHSSIYFREMDQGRDYLGDGRDDEETLEDPLNWLSFKQNFFSAAIISRDGFGPNAFLHSTPPKDDRDTTVNMFYEARLPLAMESSSNASKKLEFYFGPNDLDQLNKLDVDEFGKIIDYGWWIFGWVNRWMVRPVFDWLLGFIGNIGIAIVVMTLLIKLLLSPITWKNFMSSAKMRVLRPEMDELTEKFKDDASGKQTATMALYRQTGVNPFAGCLPMLLQMPILYAMFRFFPANIDMRGKSFLWADDLGAYDAIITWSQEIPIISSFYGNHVSGFAVMMAVSTFFYSRMSSANMPNTQQPGMPNMKVIMNLFPIITLVFFNRFAAGLNFYYFCANVISIVQMIVIKRYFIDEDKIRAKIDSNKATPKKKSSFQERLEEMQKVQQLQKKGKK